MLLTNLKDSDIQAALDEIEGANTENAKTGMIPPKRNVMDLGTVAGIVASLPDEATDKLINDPEVRVGIAAAMHEFGCFKSLTEYPLASPQEIEKNKAEIADYKALPGVRRCFAIRKDGKEYRKGGPELKGNLGRKWKSVDDLIRRNTNGVARVLRKAVANAKARTKDEGPAEKPEAKKPKAEKKSPPKRKTPPKSKKAKAPIA